MQLYLINLLCLIKYQPSIMETETLAGARRVSQARTASWREIFLFSGDVTSSLSNCGVVSAKTKHTNTGKIATVHHSCGLIRMRTWRGMIWKIQNSLSSKYYIINTGHLHFRRFKIKANWPKQIFRLSHQQVTCLLTTKFLPSVIVRDCSRDA